MKPALGWTMLSWDEIRQVERALSDGERETRDEIGFLLIHQGFADRFFPGTSVLHTRIRYALFVPWLYRRAAYNRARGVDLDAMIRRLLIELAIRLKRLGGEPYGVIGGDKLGQLTSQPPDQVYWTALRTWGLLVSDVDTRSNAIRRLNAATRVQPLDDDGGNLIDEDTEVFTGLPELPKGWDDSQSPLHLAMPRDERSFLRRKLGQVSRPNDEALSLLARLVAAEALFEDDSSTLPQELDAYAEAADKSALGVARDAAALAAIGRAVYGALVEKLLERDGGSDDRRFRAQLRTHFTEYGAAASRCDLDALETLLPSLPPHVTKVLRGTQAFVRDGNPRKFAILRECYKDSEVKRKTAQRARLLDTPRAAQRRAEWDPGRHNTTPLHYRWHIVRSMLTDLGGSR